MNEQLYKKNIASEEEEINLKQLVEQYAYYWKWFVLSLVVCVAIALVYLRYAEKIYSVNAKVLLQDENQASGELAGLGELASLTGVSSGSAFIADQMDIMKSRRILRKVVEEHKLNIAYDAKGNVKNT